MRGRRRSESDLGEADRRFRQWRRDRVFPGRIPHELWRLAAAAACVHGLQRTAERLQVDAARLEAWMGKLGEGGRSAEPASARPFVELPPLDVFGAGDCTLELEEPSGARSVSSCGGRQRLRRWNSAKCSGGARRDRHQPFDADSGLGGTR